LRLFGIDDNSKKVLPFLYLDLTRCPHCDSLHIVVSEPISLLTGTEEILDNIESFEKDGEWNNYFNEMCIMLDLSKLFLTRVKEISQKYFDKSSDVTFDFNYDYVIELELRINADENSRMIEFRDQIFDLAKTFQGFINELNTPIEKYGKPINIIHYDIESPKQDFEVGKIE
jgi:hypothetical protein